VDVTVVPGRVTVPPGIVTVDPGPAIVEIEVMVGPGTVTVLPGIVTVDPGPATVETEVKVAPGRVTVPPGIVTVPGVHDWIGPTGDEEQVEIVTVVWPPGAVIVLGVQLCPGPTGVEAQEVSTEVMKLVTTLPGRVIKLGLHPPPLVIVDHKVRGVHDPVLMGPTGEVFGQVVRVLTIVDPGPRLVMVSVDATHVGLVVLQSPETVLTLVMVVGEHVPTPPTGEDPLVLHSLHM
jgi:hypothetical protein